MDKIFMRFPGGMAKAFSISLEADDSLRVVKLFKLYKLLGSLKINISLKNASKSLEEYQSYGASLGLAINDSKALALLDNIQNKQLCKKFMHFSYSYFNINTIMRKELREAGIKYMAIDRESFSFTPSSDSYKITPTCNIKNKELMIMSHRFTAELDNSDALLFYVSGRVENDSDIGKIDELLSYLDSRDQIYYSSISKIYDYLNDFKRLIRTKGFIKNPTARSLYFSYRNKSFEIKPNEIIAL